MQRPVPPYGPLFPALTPLPLRDELELFVARKRSKIAS
jgi:hypothetical protein